MEKKPRILLADDEPSIVKMTGKRLEVEGFDVIVAMDGEEALHKAHTENPELVLVDLMLPKRNGYEVCSLLKQDPAFKQIPVIVFSAKTYEKDEKMAMECGANAYIRKPFKSPDLIAQIRALLGLPLKEGG